MLSTQQNRLNKMHVVLATNNDLCVTLSVWHLTNWRRYHFGWNAVAVAIAIKQQLLQSHTMQLNCNGISWNNKLNKTSREGLSACAPTLILYSLNLYESKAWKFFQLFFARYSTKYWFGSNPTDTHYFGYVVVSETYINTKFFNLEHQRTIC